MPPGGVDFESMTGSDAMVRHREPSRISKTHSLLSYVTVSNRCWQTFSPSDLKCFAM